MISVAIHVSAVVVSPCGGAKLIARMPLLIVLRIVVRRHRRIVVEMGKTTVKHLLFQFGRPVRVGHRFLIVIYCTLGDGVGQRGAKKVRDASDRFG